MSNMYKEIDGFFSPTRKVIGCSIEEMKDFNILFEHWCNRYGKEKVIKYIKSMKYDGENNYEQRAN